MLPAHQPLLTQLREPPRRRFIVTSTSAVEVPGPGDLGAPPTSLGWQSAGPRLRAPLGLWDAGSRPPPQNQTQLPVPGALHALQTVLYWSVYEGPSRDPSDTCVGAPQRQGASRGAGWINGSCRQVRGAALTAESASARSGSSCGKPSPARAAHAARGPFPSAHGRPCLQSLMLTPLSEGQTFRAFEGVRVPAPLGAPSPGTSLRRRVTFAVCPISASLPRLVRVPTRQALRRLLQGDRAERRPKSGSRGQGAPVCLSDGRR